MNVRPMSLSDYEAVFLLFSNTPGVTVRDADSRESIARYLERNPGLSFVAIEDGKLIGCILCGHDGRRGYLQHLVVGDRYRRKGIGKALVTHCIEMLERIGIRKSHVDVLVTNPEAQVFWSRLGWELRQDIHRYSFINSGGANA